MEISTSREETETELTFQRLSRGILRNTFYTLIGLYHQKCDCFRLPIAATVFGGNWALNQTAGNSYRPHDSRNVLASCYVQRTDFHETSFIKNSTTGTR